jgi:nitric-oxide synthase
MYEILQHAAQEFYAQLSREGWSDIEERSNDVQHEIERCGHYEHTTRELCYGAQLAWRNSARCIGRLHWQSLKIRDQRHLTTATDIFASLVEHIVCATNGGKIIPTMTIFSPQRPGEPGIQILNSQLIQYAGYMLEDGSVLGDRASVDLTEKMRQWGWQPPTERGAFDLLPIAIQIPGQSPRLFDLPPEIVLEVPLQHPCYPWFADLRLRWYALPAISNMRLEIGGISYTAAPFSGWYMGTEIGARDLADEHRYNMLPVIAQRLGLDTNKDRSLWKDRALVELNLAVLHSFAQHNVMIVDHHTAAKQFMRYMEREHSLGRDISADWGWIIPPLSPATTPVFHCPMHEEPRSPNFFACAR